MKIVKTVMVTAGCFSLPDDIIAEILPRLPAKSLLKFKRVSRSWCSFISSKYLVKAQLDHARNAPGSVLIMTSKDNCYGYWHCPVNYLFSQQKIQDVPRCRCDIPITKLFTYLVGCCNGLCCIVVDGGEYIILWNPTTGLSYRLPDPVLNEKYKYFTAKLGFGYDESNDDYKVLVVQLVHWEYTSELVELHYLCRLYSLKANSWKTVDDFMDGDYFDENHQATYLNGKLHWAKKTGENSFDIITYDLGSETAGSFEQPFPGNINSKYTAPLGVIQGCLVVCETTKFKGQRVTGTRQVWIMKEYGVKESWCKLMTLPHKPYYNPKYGIDFSILCMSAMGEMLFKLQSNLLLYNPKTNICALRHLNRDIYKHIRDSAIYVETLVSPFPHGTKLDEPK